MSVEGSFPGKLVRDHIPDILLTQGKKPTTKVLSDEEFLVELVRKLNEEVSEFQESHDVFELVDIAEVVSTIAGLKGLTQGEFLALQDKKRKERGGFSLRIYLYAEGE
jgi:predicted house-cleaning noncanonical NTP pyrophosphatase (MazG superfamily)